MIYVYECVHIDHKIDLMQCDWLVVWRLKLLVWLAILLGVLQCPVVEIQELSRTCFLQRRMCDGVSRSKSVSDNGAANSVSSKGSVFPGGSSESIPRKTKEAVHETKASNIYQTKRSLTREQKGCVSGVVRSIILCIVVLLTKNAN
jgi:hypothetical protein